MRSPELIIVEKITYVTQGRRGSVAVEASPTNQYFLQGHEGEAQNYSLTGRVAVPHDSPHRRSLQYPHCKGGSILFSTANGREVKLACSCLFLSYETT